MSFITRGASRAGSVLFGSRARSAGTGFAGGFLGNEFTGNSGGSQGHFGFGGGIAGASVAVATVLGIAWLVGKLID